MYKVIDKCPSDEHIKMFNMQENVNEAFANFKIELSELSQEQRETLRVKYDLDQKVLTYKESLFLTVPLKAPVSEQAV